MQAWTVHQRWTKIGAHHATRRVTARDGKMGGRLAFATTWGCDAIRPASDDVVPARTSGACQYGTL